MELEDVSYRAMMGEYIIYYDSKVVGGIYDDRFDKVFQYIEDHAESEQKIFFDGQIYDAFSLITSIIQVG